MNVTLYGAAGSVTGSAYYLRAKNGSSVLIDFGIFQGNNTMEARNSKLPPMDIRKLNAVVFTHAHLDHTGRLPLLVKKGYDGPVYGTPATLEFVELVLLDSVKVQTHDLKRHNRKRQRQGRPPLEPVYTEDDVRKAIGLLRPLEYNTPKVIAPGISVRVKEAGHILGSTSVEITVTEDGKEKIILFSGDVGPHDMAILKDPERFTQADLVFLESTYGDHDHRSLEETLLETERIIEDAIRMKGKILVPSFAIGRTQQLLYYMARAIFRKELPPIPIYLDSPMGIEATRIYMKHQELYDEEAVQLMREGAIKGDFSQMKISVTPEDSMALNDVEGPCMILAGAGMCNAGRILHHLRHNLWRTETHVMIVGYQGDGSLGRRLLDGAEKVKIFGEEISVKAKISSLGGFSAHAGQTDLIKWFAPLAHCKPKLVLSHGEDRGRVPLAKLIKERYGNEAVLPEYGQTFTF